MRDAILDGRLIDKASAAIAVTDEGLLRGDGAFEVIRIYRGRAFALDEHLERMERSAATLRLELDPDAVRADAERLIGETEGDGLLRVVVTRGGRRIGLLESLPQYPPTLALTTIAYAPTRVLDQVKSLSYAANMLSDRLAGERGADLALLVTPHGRVLEGATSSFFAVIDGALVTPPLSEHILDSITRRHVLTIADVREQSITLEELASASEAFLASTTREVHPVRRIDDLKFEAPGPVTVRTAQAFSAHVAEALG